LKARVTLSNAGRRKSVHELYFVTFDVFGQKPLLRELLDGAGNCLSSGQSA
jgi:hypothetical protein